MLTRPIDKDWLELGKLWINIVVGIIPLLLVTFTFSPFSIRSNTMVVQTKTVDSLATEVES